MNTAYLILLPAVLTGIVLLILGYRGRLIDGHPLCRKCRYDLSGLPATSERCPECGGDIRAPRTTRIGNRQRRGTLLLIGWGVTIPTVLIGATFLYMSVAQIPLIHYEPFFMLKRDFESPAPATSDAALAEITRRINEGKLGPADLAPIIDEILAWQADPVHRWNLEWGNLLEQCSTRRLLSKPQWESYLSHAVGVRFLTNFRVHRGTAPDLLVQVQSLRFDSSAHPWATPILRLKADWKLEVEGTVRQDTDNFDVHFDPVTLKFDENSHFYIAGCRPKAAPFSDGTHQIKIDYALEFTYIDGTRGATHGSQALAFEVVSPSVSFVNVRHDLAAIAAMRKAVWFSEDSTNTPAADPPNIRVPVAQVPPGTAADRVQDLVLHQSHPPIRGSFAIELVQGEMRWPFRNRIAMAVGFAQSGGLTLDRDHMPATLPHPGPAEIVLTPEADAFNPHSSWPLDGAIPPDVFGEELRYPINLVGR